MQKLGIISTNIPLPKMRPNDNASGSQRFRRHHAGNDRPGLHGCRAAVFRYCKKHLWVQNLTIRSSQA